MTCRKDRVRQSRWGSALLPSPPLLIGESPDQFQALQEQFELEIRPRDIVEKLFVSDMVCHTWEIIRLRRCMATIINSEFVPSLEKLLERVGERTGADPLAMLDEVRELASTWLIDRKAKARAKAMLAEFQLEETSIEAESIRRLAPELEMLDRMLASAESRRNRSLRWILQYRESLARQLEKASNEMIDQSSPLIESDPIGPHSSETDHSN